VVGEDEERPGRDLHILGSGGATRQTSALVDEALGEIEMALAVRAALFEDVGNVVVLEEELCGFEGGGGGDWTTSNGRGEGGCRASGQEGQCRP